jgi:hypothetical protein
MPGTRPGMTDEKFGRAFSVVTRGLDPRVHLFRETMDGRDEPGHDEGERRERS